ncbi:ABC transporter ATP-binding protein [Cytophagaceae bacterium DM2B3-1]|uniref:ABC transporter ATP-binding protein n=1 Tax=Xanthocytophaga flava TaxID=3048013 RepID=A0ABT7CQ37_9BACT|nr:ABC transporter ATP-binding protein [Xanthocytophaga flavus]MDJ1471165.1 ABC transporter ATP-binding protein [Xanthocytophaga flavus]MDJ1495835.1 ABC transporter ATP-binding protein [Xanthocytophaga flavus]
MAIRSSTGRSGRPGNETDEKVTLRERLGALRNLPAFFHMVWDASPSLFIANVILRIFRAAIPVLILYIGKLIIDEVILQTKQSHGSDHEHLWWLISAELGLAILSDGLGRSIALIDSLLGDLFANKTSVQIMEHAATLDLEQFEDPTFYDKLERARQQTIGRTVLLSQVLGQVQDTITMFFLAGGLIAFNPWLIVVLLLAVIPSFLGENYFNEKSYSLVRGWTPERRELDYLRYMGASDESAKEVKIFGLSDFLINRFKELSWQFYTQNKRLSIRRASWGSLLSGIGTIGYYSAYVLIIWRTIGGKISIGDLTFLAGSFRQLRSLLEGILSRFSSVSQGALYLRDLFEYFDIKPNIASLEKALPFPRPIQQGFVFENVGFRYHNSERWANRHLSFTLHPGEKLALVGENGAGKTTLVKLLARLYDPTEGRILLDGRDLREYDLKDLRENIGVIFQDFVRFKMTAGTNIAIGKIGDKENLSRIESSAQQSLANHVIEKLPARYDQMLGRSFGDGVELSGGEWQKVALGRAYMRDAQVLILDEPTAALDARAEYEVFQRFAELTQGKTAVLISHRFSTVRMADRILVLDNGELLEIGSHEELLQVDGRYAELFRLQARGYQ